MIQSIHIQNFKSIENQKFDFKPLTILTGANSSGKSSVIQAVLLYSNRANSNDILDKYLSQLGKPADLLYCYSETKTFSITPKITNNTQKIKLLFSKESGVLDFNNTQKSLIGVAQTTDFPIFEKDIYYISANRIGQENLPNNDDDKKCGVNGEYIFGFYDRQKGKSLDNKRLLSDDADAQTLEAQVNYWIKKILELELLPVTDKINNAYVKLLYENADLENFRLSPFNLGAGVSYLTKILILGLSLKEGDILIVENPEVHLHPKAISQFAEFFAFLTKGGIQVILETHSEHIINKMRYFVFKNKLSTNDVQIYYREKFDKEFIAMRINKDGRYIDDKYNTVNFPTGFFDSILKDLLEMF